MRFLKAVLQGKQEVPENASKATGVAIVKYNPADSTIELNGNYHGLAATASAGHIHSPAAAGSTASPLLTLIVTGDTSGVLTGTAKLTGQNTQNLFNGLMYVNVHNADYPGGEIRGQLSPTSAGETEYFKGQLMGTQEVPPNNTSASGSVTVLLDRLSREVFVTGNFQGLVKPAAMAHIHRGQAGIAGPVVFGLNVTKAITGTIDGSSIVSQSVADSMVAGMSYANIHNEDFPGGQIRAQLGNLVLPVKLAYFNGYKQNDKVALVWESLAEDNVRHYEVQQQTGNTWSTKTVVSSKHGTFSAAFTVLDKPLTSSSRYVFYRLKIVDLDGKITYSPVIKINFDKLLAELSIMANPVTNGLLRFTITGLPTSMQAEVSIIDFAGRALLRSTTSTLGTGALNVTKFAPGIYRLLVKVGDRILQQSFMK